MRVLITGVAGFIGSHIAEALLEEGAQVTGIDDLSTGRRTNVPEEVTFYKGDIREPSLFGLDDGWDVIYHCAASYKDRSDWERDSSTNVFGTVNVIREAQRSNARLIYFQTSLCYGPNPASPVTIDASLAPTGSYAVSKTAGERYIADSGVNYVSLRLANMYGPRNLSGPVPTFFKRLQQNESCTVVDARRDFVFIDDLVEVALKAATIGSGPYHVSSGTDVSIEEMLYAVADAMGHRNPEANRIARGADDVATLLLDPSLTERTFDWRVKTPLVEGIAKAVRWYEDHGVTETYTHLAVKG